MERILVTGGTGFLGRYIVDNLLKKGYHVRLLVRKQSFDKVPEGVDVVEGDLLDVMSIEEALEGMDGVIHSGAVVSYWKKRADEMRRVNVEGTANLVNVAMEMPVKKLVHVSSISVLGRETKGMITEQSKFVPSKQNTRYGLSKYEAEKEVFRGVQEGMPAVICNPGVIIGSGDWDKGPAKFFKMVSDGLKYYKEGGTGFVSASDVAEAVERLYRSKFVGGERFILVSDNLGYQELLDKIAKALKKKAPDRKAGRILSKMVGWVSETMGDMTGKEPLLTKETTRMSGFAYRYDGSLIERETDFVYSSLDAAIEAAAKRYLEEAR